MARQSWGGEIREEKEERIGGGREMERICRRYQLFSVHAWLYDFEWHVASI